MRSSRYSAKLPRAAQCTKAASKLALRVNGIAQSVFDGFPAEDPGVNRQLRMTRNYSCVTGACLLTRRDVFMEVGGFDEQQLPVTFNDVDFCLKLRHARYLIVYTPFAKLYHHESASRRRSRLEPPESEIPPPVGATTQMVARGPIRVRRAD